MEQDIGGEGDLVPIFSHWSDKNTWGGGWSRELWTSPYPSLSLPCSASLLGFHEGEGEEPSDDSPLLPNLTTARH